VETFTVMLHVRQAHTFSWLFVFIPLEFMFFIHTVTDHVWNTHTTDRTKLWNRTTDI